VSESTEISELIRELRLRLGLTQEEFAAKLGVTFPTVNRWENRRSKPSRMAIQLIEGLLEKHQLKDLLDKYFTR
jgi:putative transcriptional regulator